MRILIIGGHGTVGKKVTEYFRLRNEVFIAGRNNGDVQMDISNVDSIEAAFKRMGKLDAIICIAGEAKWGAFSELSEEDFYIGIKSKLMGQVNVVRIGKEFLNPNGSITLSTGILADHPVDQTTSASLAPTVFSTNWSPLDQ